VNLTDIRLVVEKNKIESNGTDDFLNFTGPFDENDIKDVMANNKNRYNKSGELFYNDV